MRCRRRLPRAAAASKTQRRWNPVASDSPTGGAAYLLFSRRFNPIDWPASRPAPPTCPSRRWASAGLSAARSVPTSRRGSGCGAGHRDARAIPANEATLYGVGANADADRRVAEMGDYADLARPALLGSVAF